MQPIRHQQIHPLLWWKCGAAGVVDRVVHMVAIQLVVAVADTPQNLLRLQLLLLTNILSALAVVVVSTAGAVAVVPPVLEQMQLPVLLHFYKRLAAVVVAAEA